MKSWANYLLKLFLFTVLTLLILFYQDVHADEPDIYQGNALKLDAQSYALEHDISLEEAFERLKQQSRIADFVYDVALREPQIFGGAWIKHTPDFGVVVQLTTGSIEQLGSYENEYGDVINLVEIETVPYTFQELKNVQSTSLDIVRQGNIEAESGINVFQNTVEIYVTSFDVQSHLQNQFTALGIAPLKVIHVPQLSDEENQIYAGLPFDDPSTTPNPDCTVGFSVEHTDGRRGVLTAAHCGDVLEYNGVNLSLSGSEYGGAHDVQWHEADDDFVVRNLAFDGTYNRFIYSGRHRNLQMINQYVCKYGVYSNAGCGYIIDKEYVRTSFTGGLVSTETWIRVHQDGINLSNEGDSGMPWFSGNVAYGVHAAGLGDDAVYMAINYIDTIDVTLFIEGAPTAVTLSSLVTSGNNNLLVLISSSAFLLFITLTLISSHKKALILSLVGVILVACAPQGDNPSSNDPANLSTMREKADIFFPRQKPVDGPREVMQALSGGELWYDEAGCVRVGDYLPIWSPELRLVERDGEWVIADEETAVVARMGDDIVFGGGETPRAPAPPLVEEETQAEIERRCAGPYWLVGEQISATTTIETKTSSDD